MKYFLDTEFIEKVKRPFFGKPFHFMQLISIGIVCEDGREYYAISTDYSKNEASDWVKENVISKLPEMVNGSDPSVRPSDKMQRYLFKPLDEIRDDLYLFFGCWRDEYFWRLDKPTEIYAYYADYDWVMFCSIFGRMIDLPRGMPMYCRDLKQMMDEVGLDKKWKDTNCPESEYEHNAIMDAKWNYKLYQQIIKHSR